MITPFNDKFRLDTYNIDLGILQQGYVSLNFIPDLSTLYVDLDGCSDIISSSYRVDRIDELPVKYIIAWSSLDSIDFELKALIESGQYRFLHVRYISSN